MRASKLNRLRAWAWGGVLTLLLGPALAATPSPYAHAVQDAAVAEATEIVDTLVPVHAGNDKLTWRFDDRSWVKVVTWKSRHDYESYILPNPGTSENENYVLWVTMAPYVQNFCRNYLGRHPAATPSQLKRRLKQRLGLHPDWQYDLFVELWVPLASIVRPCVDPDPSDTRCDLNFTATPPVVTGIRDYPAFYKNLYFKSFRTAPGTPWTGLGYSYDWKATAGEVGESEFILAPATPYIIESATPTWQYCAP